MKKIKLKKKKTKLKTKIVFFLFFFILGIVISYKILDNQKLNIDNKKYIKTILLLSNYNNSNKFFFKKMSNYKISNIVKPTKLLDNNYKNLVQKESKIKKTINSNNMPLIYIYNTHQTEEYSPSNFLEESINPTVQMVNYILENVFSNNHYKTITEEESIKNVLNINNWNYSKSYKASRILLEEKKAKYPSLKYFIDVHRDSLKKDKTTIEINNKNYAKILFIVGLENKEYEKNLEFITKINNKINELYPNLSKGIYKKEGPGVNGVYNQDFSEYTILVEIGGYENKTDEVLNTTLAFSECFMEVIKYEEK